MRRKKCYIWFWLVCCLALLCDGCAGCNNEGKTGIQNVAGNSADALTELDKVYNDYVIESTDILSIIPKFSEAAYVVINDNIPYFTLKEKKCESAFEIYSELDELGRCGVAYANVCMETMPTEERGPIGQIKPSGWQLVKYDIIDGKYLYNRCHLIGYQLAGENANEKNLITGTRYFNVSGMLPFENMVCDYVKETQNHVLYRVTPLYNKNDLVATGVLIEAYSVEDKGAGICFNVFIYNSQPGIQIDYATGESSIIETEYSFEETVEEQEYILNTSTKKFHVPNCPSVDKMKEKNRKKVVSGREDIIEDGYQPCQRCNP